MLEPAYPPAFNVFSSVAATRTMSQRKQPRREDQGKMSPLASLVCHLALNANYQGGSWHSGKGSPRPL